MKFEEIKKIFTKGTIQQKIEFLKNGVIYEDDIPFYQKVILNHHHTSDEIYTMYLIELSENINFFSEKLLCKYSDYLLNKYHYVVKLSVLDYFKNMDIDSSYKSILEDLFTRSLNKRNFEIVKVQLLLNLIKLRTKNEPTFKSNFYSKIEKAKDYRTILRVMNNLISMKNLSIFNLKELQIIRNIIIQKKHLGNSISVYLNNYGNSIFDDYVDR